LMPIYSIEPYESARITQSKALKGFDAYLFDRAL
jgi:hypothetical protein